MSGSARCLIVFLTSSKEYAFDAFPVHPFDYLVKPYSAARLDHVLSGAIRLMEESEQLVEIHLPRQTIRLPHGQIVAVTSHGHALDIFTVSGACLKSSQTFAELEAALRGDERFLPCNRGVLVNMDEALKLDGDIREDLFALRASLAAGSWTSVESAGEELRTTVLKREYAYAGTDDLDVRIDALNAEISTLSGRLEGGTQTIRAPFAGTYSAVADGYEAVLTPAALENMTVAQYDAIAPEAVSSTVGRLIAGEEWRFVTVLSAADAARLQKGQALSLRAATGVDFDLDVTVERIGREENGRVIVVLRGGSHLAYVTLLRAQNVELILARYEGLRIPKNALRVDADGSSGVYCLVGLRAYRKPVEVLWQGEDYCLVRPVGIETTSESLRQLYTLRAGDEAIVSANDLYDGKVVE